MTVSCFMEKCTIENHRISLLHRQGPRYSRFELKNVSIVEKCCIYFLYAIIERKTHDVETKKNGENSFTPQKLTL